MHKIPSPMIYLFNALRNTHVYTKVRDYETKNIDSAAGISVAETLDSVSDVVSVVNVGANLPPTLEAPENVVSQYVPPPPTAFEVAAVEDELIKELKGGRFLIKCISGEDIKRKSDPNKIPRIDPYIKFKLGVSERLPWKETKAKRKLDNYPNFEGELISFDVIDPASFIYGGDVQLHIELYHKSTLKV